jgi:peptidoglycan hydrolase CwlO-like protein
MSRQEEMAQAIRRQLDQRDESRQVDRTGWSRQQWLDDADERFNHIDGAITSLVNGHVVAMLAEIEDLRGEVEDLKFQVGERNKTILALQEQIDGLDEEIRHIHSQHEDAPQ